MNIIFFFVYIYLLLRPYYFFSSGGLQISDLFLVVAFFLFTIIKKNSKLYITKKQVLMENRNYFLFVILCFLINMLYYIIYPDTRFIMSTLYFIFNLFAVYIFSLCIKEDEDFADKAFKIFSLNILIQFLLCVLNIGKYWDSFRYMGTFNDPNQFGYYILLSYSYVYLLSSIKKNKEKFDNYIVILNLVLSLFLIIKCSSTGMFLGFVVFIVLSTIDYMKRPLLFFKRNLNKIIILLIFLVPIFITVTLSKPSFFSAISTNITNSDLLNRVVKKVNRASSKSDNEISILEDRALDYIIFYPQFLIWGSGEGGEDRFPLVNHYTEIHSTFPAIMFYYGFIPTMILLLWMFKKMKKINMKYLVVYIALIVESFTLANQRQALFWGIFCLAVALRKEDKNEKMSNCMLDGKIS